MSKNILFILFIGGYALAAQLGGLNRSSDVTTATELGAYAIDPSAIEARLDAIEAVLTGGITTNLSNLVVTDGVVKGTY